MTNLLADFPWPYKSIDFFLDKSPCYCSVGNCISNVNILIVGHYMIMPARPVRQRSQTIYFSRALDV